MSKDSNDCWKKLANDVITQIAQVNNESLKPAKKLKKVMQIQEKSSDRMNQLLADRDVA